MIFWAATLMLAATTSPAAVNQDATPAGGASEAVVSEASAPAQVVPTVTWSAPTYWVEGQPYVVEIQVISNARTDSRMALWLLTSSAFTVDGRAVRQRDDEPVFPLEPEARFGMRFDLAPALRKSASFNERKRSGSFELDYAPGYAEGEALRVTYYELADPGQPFMEMTPEALRGLGVHLETNRGTILLELWPQVAPGHVRNFLDLCATGFYDKTIFHRIIPGFMIQGGSPDGTPTGGNERTVNLEPSTRPHVPGVLSMARGDDPNSASSQFFIMHGTQPSLDGQYSSFGRVVFGTDTVDRVATTRRDALDRPAEDQTISRARIVRIPVLQTPEGDDREPK